MEKNNLITMANQIGAFFKSYPDKEQATKDIAGHLNKFWPPVMRKKIVKNISTKFLKRENKHKRLLGEIKKYLKQ